MTTPDASTRDRFQAALDTLVEQVRQDRHILVAGPPQRVAACKASHTGRFLKKHLA